LFINHHLSNFVAMAVTDLNLNFVQSALSVVAATGVAYFIATAYRHRSHINQLHKQGFVSLPYSTYTRAS
jgi:hypothetical protein